jgi:hypothetical protein
VQIAKYDDDLTAMSFEDLLVALEEGPSGPASVARFFKK